MNFEDVEKIIEKARTEPKKTIMIFILLAIIVFAITYGNAFFSAIAKNHAKSSIPTQDEKSKLSTPPKQASSEKGNPAIIEQHTEGDQSPAIVTNKDVEIMYKGSK